MLGQIALMQLQGAEEDTEAGAGCTICCLRPDKGMYSSTARSAEVPAKILMPCILNLLLQLSTPRGTRRPAAGAVQRHGPLPVSDPVDSTPQEHFFVTLENEVARLDAFVKVRRHQRAQRCHPIQLDSKSYCCRYLAPPNTAVLAMTCRSRLPSLTSTERGVTTAQQLG